MVDPKRVIVLLLAIAGSTLSVSSRNVRPLMGAAMRLTGVPR